MSYVVLARKWRPQSFDDLVGQGHVSSTLASAIQQNRVAHAFLFTGVRGVGKTSSARILAKSLNCVKGPTATPCQVCPPCVEITAGSDVDVQEIDGASYNGVDEVRRLQESLPYRPARDRFKIFVVDEVHMLSNAAWNAFLKTLEEPPPHVKFVFATTEVHKVPGTILSRCQRYDFKLLTAQTIAGRLREVLEHEGIGAEDAALSTLAREAAGSMRDAMSLLDQVVASLGEGEKLTAEGVARVLGVADRSVLHRLAGALVEGDASTCVRVVGELSGEGYDLAHASKSILAFLRDLVVAKVVPDPASLLDLADEELQDVSALAERADADDLLRLHQGFSRAYDEIVRSGQVRGALEMALVRLARRPPLLPVDELLRRVGELERRLAGAPPAGSSGGGPGGGRPPERGPDRRPPARPPAPRRADAPFPQGPVSSPRAPAPPAPPARPLAPPAGSAPAPPARPSGADLGGERAAPAAEPPPDLSGWRAVIDGVRKRRPALASVLEHASLLAFGPTRVAIGYEANSFLMHQATDASSKAILDEVASAHLGARVPVDIVDAASAPRRLPTVAQVANEEQRARLEEARKAVIAHPLVTAAIELLGAEIQSVRLAE